VTDALRFGLIGAGAAGRVHAANLARRIEGARLVAVADIAPGAAEGCANENGAEAAYKGEAELIAHAGLDAVVIATPPEFHAGAIEAAAAAGLHVFCEKPLERTLERADEALAAVEQAGVKLFIGLNRRYDPHYLRLAEAVRAGKIGRPLTVRLVARDPIEVFGHTPRPAGDLFLSTTVHELDFAEVIVGSPIESVYAVGGVLAEGDGPVIDDPDTAVTLMRFEGGASGSIDNSRISMHGYDQRIEVLGTGGMIEAGNLRPDDTVMTDGDGEHRSGPLFFFGDRYRQSYVAEMQAFVDCIRGDTPPPVGPAEARRSQVLALAAFHSYREERPVRISEVG
jgi:myo-inositol 2-dehydrogenase/D-chiro-inositol 1-dehydrogenase